MKIIYNIKPMYSAFYHYIDYRNNIIVITVMLNFSTLINIVMGWEFCMLLKHVQPTIYVIYQVNNMAVVIK